jgi:hypothetical protein
VNKKHERVLKDIFTDPVRANIAWLDIESLLSALGAEIKEGNGSRLRVTLNGIKATFHRPHPRKEAGKGTVESVRDFLTDANVQSDR